MSNEHAYAYEAGYRDGSINYELEHCPACKNVADLQEALDENARLRSCLSDDVENARMIMGENSRLREQNARLRELVCHLYYVKPRDVTSILVNGEVLDFDELMAEVGLRWEDA